MVCMQVEIRRQCWYLSQLLCTLVSWDRIKARDPPISASIELELQSCLFFMWVLGSQTKILMFVIASTLLSLSPNLHVVTTKTLSQLPSMFCPSSLFLQICYKNMKKATSGTAESHLKTTEQNKQKTRFIYYCVFVVCIGDMVSMWRSKN